jgi:hypothetical protein
MQHVWELGNRNTWESLDPLPLDKADFQQLCASTPPAYLIPIESEGQHIRVAQPTGPSVSSVYECKASPDLARQPSMVSPSALNKAVAPTKAEACLQDHMTTWESVQSLLGKCASLDWVFACVACSMPTVLSSCPKFCCCILAFECASLPQQCMCLLSIARGSQVTMKARQSRQCNVQLFSCSVQDLAAPANGPDLCDDGFMRDDVDDADDADVPLSLWLDDFTKVSGSRVRSRSCLSS